MLIGAIGPVLFSVTRENFFTFSDLARTRTIRFAEHQTLVGEPKLQHIGRELDTLSLAVTIGSATPSVLMVDAAILALLTLSGTGEEVSLVFGIRYWGKWVITSLNITHRQFHAGKTQWANVALSLKEYN